MQAATRKKQSTAELWVDEVLVVELPTPLSDLSIDELGWPEDNNC